MDVFELFEVVEALKKASLELQGHEKCGRSGVADEAHGRNPA